MATLAVRNQKCVVGVGSKVFAYHLNTIKDGLDLVPTGSLDISALSRSIPLINIENKDESDDCTVSYFLLCYSELQFFDLCLLSLYDVFFHESFS